MLPNCLSQDEHLRVIKQIIKWSTKTSLNKRKCCLWDENYKKYKSLNAVQIAKRLKLFVKASLKTNKSIK